MSGNTTIKRVLVHLKKGESHLIGAQFVQSVVNFFDPTSDTVDICVQKEGDRIIVKEPRKNEKAVTLKRPSFCPIKCMTSKHISELPNETKERGIDCGTAVLVESSDGKLLLTRRALHLRIFPGVWVPPGGHIEGEETIGEAGLRELMEETGLQLTQDQFQGGDLKVLACWESVYPFHLDRGLPKRHHIVVYLHVKLKDPYTAEKLTESLKLYPGEVSASAWLDDSIVKSIVRYGDEDCDESWENDSNLPKTVKCMVVTWDSVTMEDRPISGLLNRSSLTGEDYERVSTGTRYALSEYLKLKET